MDEKILTNLNWKYGKLFIPLIQSLLNGYNSGCEKESFFESDGSGCPTKIEVWTAMTLSMLMSQDFVPPSLKVLYCDLVMHFTGIIAQHTTQTSCCKLETMNHSYKWTSSLFLFNLLSSRIFLNYCFLIRVH